ncbi:AAA family ATPase [Enterococcus sp.]|uniref:AAA family ATPase n=1 Tax=Enterococcus sp. TaxID=35783 RepID=UPI00291356D5|nr:AAA family ATPase [Enterococcus sp.]MDU5335738.1 AAA family ATPase [Enterococcus sp.]
MEFHLLTNSSYLQNDSLENGFYLINTNWDDWFTYSTSHALWIKNDHLLKYIGTTKIGSFDMQTGQRSPELCERFSALNNNYFSLGNDEAFYIELNSSDVSMYRETILYKLKDIAFDEELYSKAKETHVFKVSLSRDILTKTIEGRFRRLAKGNVKLSNYHFSYKINDIGETLDFKVNHDVLPPSNIHTIIGRNGVGKSHVLNKMINSILSNGRDFTFDTSYEDNFFSNILSVNYSTFENKEIFKNNSDRNKGQKYYHLSTKSESINKYNYFNSKEEQIVPEGMDALFIESLISCFSKKPRRWSECIKILYSDPIFKSLNILDLYNKYAFDANFNDFLRVTHNLFKKLSSGHKIVILTLTKLVELSEEKTLIIMDEPEMHLHPPLLGSFIRCLSYLLIDVNGVAILATHSPIILQETPVDCVYKLSRDGDFHKAERPSIETFGENIGILTSEVFGLEVIDSGFHTIIDQVVNYNYNLDQSRQILQNHIGSEANNILATKIYNREIGNSREVQVDE